MFTLLLSAIALIFGKDEKNKTYKNEHKKIHFNECLRVRTFEENDTIHYRKTSNKSIKKTILSKRNRKPDIRVKSPFQHYAQYMGERYISGTFTKEYPTLDDYAAFVTKTWMSLRHKRPYIVKYRNNKRSYVKEYNILNKIKDSEVEREIEEMDIDIC